MQDFMELKPVILIGGSTGVGKTTLSKKLSELYDFEHRIGTGFIREVLRSVIPVEEKRNIEISKNYPWNTNFNLNNRPIVICHAINYLIHISII